MIDKRIDLGSMAVPSSPLLIIEDDSSYSIDVFAGERHANRIKAGTPVHVRLQDGGPLFQGIVAQAVPAIDSQSRTFLVKVAIKASRLKTGQYAKVEIPVGKRSAIIVPGKAIVERGQLTSVYTVDEKGIV